MTKLLQRVDVTLRSFYIFNSEYGKKEGTEEKKILYYYPDDIQLNTKINDIGLSEAIIAFTGTFTNEEECKALHTQKTTQLFYQPEKGFWMVMVLNVPKEIRAKDGVDITEYRGGEVHDSIYTAILKQSYNLYRLYNGTFVSSLQKEDNLETSTKTLSQRLCKFFNLYIQKLKLPVCQFNEITQSIQYLPLEKTLFLRAHNLMNITKATFPVIKETILMIDEEIVCSGDINATDLYSLHEHLTGSLVSKTNELNQDNSNITSSPSTEDPHDGLFLGSDEQYVFLRIGCQEIKKYLLIVYSILNATLCLVINGDEVLPKDFKLEFRTFISPQLSSLARDIENVAPATTTKHPLSPNTPAPTINDSSPKYLFINEQSLKHLTNIPNNKSRSKIAPNGITTNVLNLIADLKTSCDVTKNRNSEEVNTPDFEEIQIKTTNDFWIVKRRCNWRDYFVIIFNSKATLLDITQEAKRIFEQELKDAVFFDN